MPANTRGLSPAELRSRIDNHFADILKPENAGGKCSQWDVINEPYSNFEVQGRIGGVNEVEPSDGMLGNLEMAKWFHNVRRLDPQARLYLNDFDVLEAGGLDVRRQDYLFALANWLLNNGAPLDGIGLQGHFERITPPAVMQSIIERYSQLPLALAITEFDVNMLDEQLQADYTRDVMTLIFSYPKFNDFLLWGFWEKSHWQPHAALYRGDWSSKPNALVFNELVFRDWWSSKSGVTDANGKFALRGFKGTYNVTVVYQRISHTATATIDSSGETAININVITSRNAGRRAATRRIEN
jgi:GH35 family endo-1,4-beta-xylanase